MKSYHFLSPHELHGLMRGKSLEPISLFCPAPNLISHGTLTLYCLYERPLTFRLSRNNPVDPCYVTIAFDEVEGDGRRQLTLTLPDFPFKGEATGEDKGERIPKSQPLSEGTGRRVFWVSSKEWEAGKNKPLTGGILTLAFNPLWRNVPTQPLTSPLAPPLTQPLDNGVTPTESHRGTTDKESPNRKSNRNKRVTGNDFAPHTESFPESNTGIGQANKALPSSIEVDVSLKVIWLDNETAYAQVGDDKPCRLHLDRTAYSEVRVEPRGTGNYQMASGGERIPFIGTDLLNYRLIFPEPFLYRKFFKKQPEGRFIHHPMAHHPNASRADIGNIPYLWAYGGHQVEDDICPFVVSMDSMRHETFIRLHTLLYWRERGIVPFEGIGRQIFQDTFEKDQTRTFFESIQAGKSIIHLEVGLDGTGQPIRVPYRSYRLAKNFIFYKQADAQTTPCRKEEEADANEEEPLPPGIQLYVRLKAVAVDNGTACGRFGDLEPCPLYPPSEEVFSEVQVEVLEKRSYQTLEGKEIPFTGTDIPGYRLVLPEGFLYRKLFLTQPEGRMVCQGSGTIPGLWAYGGKEAEGDMRPFVFTLQPDGKKTVAQASSLSVWRKTGLPIEEDGFQDAFGEDQTRSFCESIEAGMSVIHLEATEKGQTAGIPYQSCRIEDNVIFYEKREEP